MNIYLINFQDMLKEVDFFYEAKLIHLVLDMNIYLINFEGVLKEIIFL